MDTAYYRCPCGDVISGEYVVDPTFADRVRLHEAVCPAITTEISKGDKVIVIMDGLSDIGIFTKISATGHRVVSFEGHLMALEPLDTMVPFVLAEDA